MQNFLDTFSGYIRSEAGKLNLLGKTLSILLIFFIAFISSKIITAIITKRISSQSIRKYSSYSRIVTIMELIKKLVKIVIYFIAVTTAMDIVGIKTSSIIATVGVGSLALSFGAQNLVKDVINGFFIIIEDQYAVGDLVEISGFEGYVEELGLRCTRLRDFSGMIHIIPNGNISIVTNEQRGTMRSKVDVKIDIKEDPEKVLKIIENSLQGMEHDPKVKKGPLVWGITDNTERGYIITAVAYSVLEDKYDIEYEMRKRIVTALNKNNIKLPQFRGEINEVK